MDSARPVNSSKRSILKHYEDLELRFAPSGSACSTYTTPVNFRESLSVPIHRWYGYKEGFSPSFVQAFFHRYSKRKTDVVFDPFGGVGTTCLEAIKRGFTAYSMDVNPLSHFAAKVKTRKYSDKNIKSVLAALAELQASPGETFSHEINNKTVERYFDPTTWKSLTCLLARILRIRVEKTRNLFLLALLSLVEEVSTHHKNGNGVKRKRIVPAPVDSAQMMLLFADRVSMYCDDIAKTQLHASPGLFFRSNIVPYELPRKADIVLTSPPYANCFDYSKVYLTELWLGGFFTQRQDQEAFRESSIKSHVHYSWKRENAESASEFVNKVLVPYLAEGKLWNNKIPGMISGYFSDMTCFLRILSKNLNENATVGIVVGNSVYGGVPVATDILLAEIAETMGYKCESIEVYRKIIASSQQMRMLTAAEKEFVRESLIVLKWKSLSKV